MRFNVNNGEELNSGKLQFGYQNTIRNELKKVTGIEFKKVGELYFKYKNFKYDDFKQYFGIDKDVDIKIKTYYIKNLEKSHLVLIEDITYEIVTLDYTEDMRYMYIYLTKRGV